MLVTGVDEVSASVGERISLSPLSKSAPAVDGLTFVHVSYHARADPKCQRIMMTCVVEVNRTVGGSIVGKSLRLL